MMLTETDAKTKWCAHAVEVLTPPAPPAVATAQASGNRGQAWDGCACLASGCMAWRWYDAETVTTGRRGYCGEAGVPTQ